VEFIILLILKDQLLLEDFSDPITQLGSVENAFTMVTNLALKLQQTIPL
jgi:hypothetical protein